MEELLHIHPAIRTVRKVDRTLTNTVLISRKGLDNISTARDQEFSMLVIPVMIGGLDKYSDEFGQLELCGAFFKKLNFFFFMKDGDYYIVSYDKVPMEDIIPKLRNSLGKLGLL
jgi:hypothetical protein